jgi:hypothetical protein
MLAETAAIHEQELIQRNRNGMQENAQLDRHRSWTPSRERRHRAQPDVNIRTKFGIKTPHDLIQIVLVGVTDLLLE